MVLRPLAWDLCLNRMRNQDRCILIMNGVWSRSADHNMQPQLGGMLLRQIYIYCQVTAYSSNRANFSLVRFKSWAAWVSLTHMLAYLQGRVHLYLGTSLFIPALSVFGWACVAPALIVSSLLWLLLRIPCRCGHSSYWIRLAQVLVEERKDRERFIIFSRKGRFLNGPFIHA